MSFMVETELPSHISWQGGSKHFFLNTYSTVKKLWFQNSIELKITCTINAF